MSPQICSALVEPIKKVYMCVILSEDQTNNLAGMPAVTPQVKSAVIVFI